MDIRKFFAKKVDKENGAASKHPSTAPVDDTPKVKKSVKPQLKTKVDSSSKRIRKDIVNDNDDDEVVVIEKSNKRKDAKVSPSASAKAKPRPAPVNDTTIFLDDSSFDDDEDLSPPKSLKKQKIIKPDSGTTGSSASVQVSSKIESPKIARSSPRTRKVPPPSTNPTTTPPNAKKRTPTQTKNAKTEPRPTVLQPSLLQDHFDMNLATPQCLVGLTFCLSGIMPNLSRDEASEMIKILGGRVTTAVSSKTTYLVLGDVLEDGRPVELGSKYVRATTPESTTILIRGVDYFYGLLQQYSDLKSGTSKTHAINSDAVEQMKLPEATKDSTMLDINKAPISKSQPALAVAPKSNPYASATTLLSASASTSVATNPYARKANPYAKTTPTVATKPIVTLNGTDDRKMPAKTDRPNDADAAQLWVDKYKPLHSSEILGNQDAVRKLSVWLASWEQCFNSSHHKVKSFSAPNGPWKAALLSGPPGIGSKYLNDVYILTHYGNQCFDHSTYTFLLFLAQKRRLLRWSHKNLVVMYWNSMHPMSDPKRQCKKRWVI
jgi:replication factor C subunit 1